MGRTGWGRRNADPRRYAGSVRPFRGDFGGPFRGLLLGVFGLVAATLIECYHSPPVSRPY